MASTPINGNATTGKKIKIKQLPDGLSQVTESNFRKAMAFRLETDSQQTGEVMMVAYKATMANDNNSANSEIDFEKLTLDQLHRLTTSGKHDNKPYNFDDVAIKKAGSTGLIKIGCSYFLALCQANPEVDVCFANTMEENLMGNTNSQLDRLETLLTESSGGTEGSIKKRVYAAIVDMSTAGATIAGEMKETNRIAQELNLAMKEMNRIAKQSQLIQLAQHLGKEDILEGLLADLASDS